MFQISFVELLSKISQLTDLEMVEGKQVKEMAFRARCLKEVLLGQVGEFYERWNERLKSLSEKHKQEKKLLLSRGIFFVTMSDF